MTAMQRTAYPRFRRLMSARELATHFTPTPEERAFIHATGRSVQHRLNLAVLLKVFQYLSYFPRLNAVPVAVVQHLIVALGLDAGMRLRYESQRTLRDHQQQIRVYLNALTAGHHRRHVIAGPVNEPAKVLNT